MKYSRKILRKGSKTEAASPGSVMVKFSFGFAAPRISPLGTSSRPQGVHIIHRGETLSPLPLENGLGFPKVIVHLQIPNEQFSCHNYINAVCYLHDIFGYIAQDNLSNFI